MSARWHLALALLFAAVVPAASWAFGSGGLAYRMYARSGSYRIRVTIWNRDGRAEPVSPTALAARARGAARHYLAGADRWLSFPHSDVLAEELDDLAAFACQAVPTAVRARIELDRRHVVAGPIETRGFEANCR